MSLPTSIKSILNQISLLTSRGILAQLTLTSTLILLPAVVSANSTDFSPAKLLSNERLRHPDQHYNQRNQNASYDSGVVELIYIVDKLGRPMHISVIRSTMPKFEQAAIDTIKTYRYQPAVLAGQAIQSVHKTNIVFELNRTSIGFDRWYLRDEGKQQDEQFSKLYKKLKKALRAKNPDFEKSESLLKKMTKIRSRSFSRLVNMNLAALEFAETFNRPKQQLSALSNLVWLDEISYEGKQQNNSTSMSRVRSGLINLLIKYGRNAEAEAIYQRYVESDELIREKFAVIISQIEAIKLGEQAVARTEQISASGNTHFLLLKRRFTLDQVDGEIDAIQLRCSKKFSTLDYQQNAEYMLPSAWGQCFVEVLGKAQSAFRVLEY